MYSLLFSLSFLSVRDSKVSIGTLDASLFTRALFIQFISMGSRMISWIWSETKERLSSTRGAIWRKSEEMRMDTEFLISSSGFRECTYFINQSNILMSQCTEISMSSSVYELERYFSKYFMLFRSKVLSHLKS